MTAKHTPPHEFAARLLALAEASPAPFAPAYLGCLPVLAIDRERARQMAEARRLFNEEPDDPWGHREDRHRGDEATQAKTWADGCLGEAVVGRVLRSVGNKKLKLAPPVEWVPSAEPDVIYTGGPVERAQFWADIKSASYKRPDGRTSWSLNEAAHKKAMVDGYIAADLAAGDLVHAWFYTRAAVEATGDLLTRPSKSGKASSFYRLFFPVPA